MQTKLVILASVTGGISALCFSTNQNILLSVGTALIASVFYLAAYLSKDKKDKQIEEIHTITTNSNKRDHLNDTIKDSQEKRTPESPYVYNITNEFLASQHNLSFSQANEDIRMLSRKLRLQGRFNGTYGMNQLAAQIACYVNDFLAQIEDRATKIHGPNFSLDQQVKKQLETYLKADINFLKQKLASTFPDRVKSAPMTNAISEGEAVIRKAYSSFFLKRFS